MDVLTGSLLLLGFGFLVPLACWGALSLWLEPSRRRRAHVWLLLGLVLAYALSVVTFFVSDRYRIPIVPLLARVRFPPPELVRPP